MDRIRRVSDSDLLAIEKQEPWLVKSIQTMRTYANDLDVDVEICNMPAAMRHQRYAYDTAHRIGTMAYSSRYFSKKDKSLQVDDQYLDAIVDETEDTLKYIESSERRAQDCICKRRQK